MNELTVSDPSRKLNRILVTLSGQYESTGNDAMSIGNSDDEGTLLVIDLPQGVYAGKSVTITLK